MGNAYSMEQKGEGIILHSEAGSSPMIALPGDKDIIQKFYSVCFVISPQDKEILFNVFGGPTDYSNLSDHAKRMLKVHKLFENDTLAPALLDTLKRYKFIE
jgi:hypothetical protein